MAERTASYPGFPDGINNVGRSDDVPNTAAEKLQNVDIIGPRGRVQRRAGYAQVYAGVDIHSMHAAFEAFVLGVEGTTLKRWVDFEVAPLTLESNVQGKVSYVELNGSVVWSSRNKNGQVSAQGQPMQFGVPTPAGQPSIAVSGAGGWHAGTVMVAVTHSTTAGVESGAPPAVYATLAEGQGITLSAIPQNSEADYINVYATDPDGEVMYLRATIPMGTTTYTLNYVRGRRPLDMQHTDILPAGELLAEHNGIVYVAVGGTVYHSLPFKPWAYHITQGFFQESRDVDLLLSGDNGVFIGSADGVYAYVGDTPETMRRSWVSGPAIPGASLSIDGGFINPQYQGRTVALWWTTAGSMIIGLPDGSAEVVRDMEFRAPDAEQGAMAGVIRNGVKQILTVMQNPKADAALAFNDDLSVEIHRNGVTP